jgi:hypothetical protein
MPLRFKNRKEEEDEKEEKEEEVDVLLAKTPPSIRQ